MTIREIDFVTGFETSSAPTTSDPSASTDSMTKGYADTTYTPRSNIYGKVTDVTALKAIGSSSRFDEQVCYVAGLDLFYEFDADSSATPDDDLVVQPTSGTGRWLKIETGGSSGDGTASALDALIQKVENEKGGVITTAIDNSAIRSGLYIPMDQYIEGNLMADFTSGGSTLHVVWNAIAMNGSDKNFDTTTNWSAIGAGASLTTSATKKIGTASLQFDKNNSATEAAIRYDVGGQVQVIGGNYRVWFWINLPSITNLSNVLFRIYSDTTSNYRTWTATTDYSGAALATGWNLMYFDISTGGTATGSGFTYGSLFRYCAIGVTTSSAGQTYSSILVDALYYSYGDIAKFGTIANEFSIFDSSINSSIIFDSANTRHDGAMTLSSSLGSNVTGGISGASRGRIKRSNIQVNAAGMMNFESGLSGTASTTQYMRVGTMLRESLSGSYSMYVDQTAVQMYPVTAVGASTIDVTDSSDTHLNLLNGDTIDIFRPQYVSGTTTYTYVKNVALTANSTYSSGTTTLTVVVSSIAVGDIVVKRNVTQVALSAVSSTTNENFSAASIDASPDGAVLLGDFVYPNADSVYAHFTLGDINSSEATRNRKGSTGLSLTMTGSVNTGDSFLKGRYSSSGYNGSGGTATNYLSLSPSTEAVNICGDSSYSTRVQASFWFYDSIGFDGNERYILCVESDIASGWMVAAQAGSNNIRLIFNNGGFYTLTGSYSTGQWVHAFVDIVDNSTSTLYLNGVNVGTTSGNILGTGNYFLHLGKRGANNSGQNGIKVADLIIWRNGTALTTAQIQYLYNSGSYLNTTAPNTMRLNYTVNGQSGQKVSMRIKQERSTTAITPNLSGLGFVKK